MVRRLETGRRVFGSGLWVGSLDWGRQPLSLMHCTYYVFFARETGSVGGDWLFCRVRTSTSSRLFLRGKSSFSSKLLGRNRAIGNTLFFFPFETLRASDRHLHKKRARRQRVRWCASVMCQWASWGKWGWLLPGGVTNESGEFYHV